jgi:hypothetical protein
MKRLSFRLGGLRSSICLTFSLLLYAALAASADRVIGLLPEANAARLAACLEQNYCPPEEHILSLYCGVR